jgi:outer membrane protein assembly factor BamB
MTCPYCGALDQRVASKCQGCDRFLVYVPDWAKPHQRHGLFGRYGFIFMTQRKWLVLALLVVLSGAFIWHNYHIVPNPITLIFQNPSTGLTSSLAPGQWHMPGATLERTRYVTSAASQPAGRLLWSTEPGLLTGISQPAVSDGVIYVGSDFKFLALDSSNGQVKWQRNVGGLVNSSPAVAGDLVYFGSTDSNVWALDRHTGDVEWAFTTGNYISSSPLVHNGFLFIGSGDRHMYALDAANGDKLWAFKTGGDIHTPPTLHNGVLYFTSSDASLYSVNYRTGQARMNFRTRALNPFEPPVVANGLVYMNSDRGILVAKAGIREVPGRFAFERVWRILYVRGFVQLEPPAQQGFKWRFQLGNFDNQVFFSSTPAVTPDALYIGDSTGVFHARKAQNASLEDARLWEFEARGIISAAPLVVQDTVYFGTEGGFLYALDRHSGREIWNLDLGSPIKLPPAFAEGKLFVRTDDGRMNAIV